MKVLFITFHFPPSATAGVHRSLRFCKYLREFGCTTYVLTRRVSPELGGDELLAQLPQDVPVTRVFSGKETNPSPTHAGTPTVSALSDSVFRGTVGSRIKSTLKPLWQLLTETPDRHAVWKRSFVRTALELVAREKIDAIYTSGPPHSIHLAGLKIKERTGLPWIADFRDPWARRPWSSKENPLGQKLFPYFERKVINAASYVILNTSSSLDNFREAYAGEPMEKFVHLPNGLDSELVGRISRFPAKIAPNSTPVLLHAGSLYGQRNPTTLIHALHQLNEDGVSVKYQQIGAVANTIPLMETAQKLGIEKLVEVLPAMSHENVLRRMQLADLHLILQPDGPLMIPGKAFEMLAFEQPIVAVCDSGVTADLTLQAGGTVAESRDIEGISKAITLALAMRGTDELVKARLLCRELYDGRSLTGKLAELFKHCIG